MDTTVDQFRQRVQTQITTARWALGTNGALAVALGVLIIIWPTYALVLGIFAAWGAFAAPLDRDDSIMLGLTGVVSILFGIAMIAEPGAGALVLLALIAAYMLVISVAELAIAIGGKRLLNDRVKRALGSPSSQLAH